MHTHFCSRFWRRFSLLPTGLLLLLTFLVPTSSSGLQRESASRSEIGLEISLPDAMRPRIRLAGPYGGGGMTLILRRSLKINNPNAAGDFTALDVRAEGEGDAIKVTLSLIYNDLSNQEWWKDKKEKLAGSYLIREGQTIRPVELEQFGIEPFEMKAIDARPVVLKPGEGPRIADTSALKVERLERHLDNYRVWLKNKSDKNIVSYTISIGRQSIQTGGGGHGPASTVLAAGGTSRELYVDGPESERSGIKVVSVIFDDGSFEGDPTIATHFQATEEGVRVQAPSVLRMIEQTLKVADSDLRAAFDKLEAELWVIPEAMHKQPALQFLKAKFPDQDEKALSALYEVFKGGLYDARNIALSSLGDTGRTVKGLEERGQFASAVESIRRTLEHLRETLGKINASQR